MPTNPKDIEFLLKDLASGQVSPADVDAILRAATAAKNQHQLASMKTAMSGKLKTLENFKDQLIEFISEWWEDDEVEAWKESLLALSGGKGAKEVEAIVDVAGDASNARNELQNMSDEEDDYGEIETSMEDDIGKALDGLEAYWAKYAGGAKPAKKPTAKRR